MLQIGVYPNINARELKDEKGINLTRDGHIWFKIILFTNELTGRVYKCVEFVANFDLMAENQIWR